MGKPRLINATDLVKHVLEERDKIRTEVVERYSLGVPVPDRFGQAMRGGIHKALRCIETAPTIDAVEVVRCKDCKRYRGTNYGFMVCGKFDVISCEDDFCVWGERKMDGYKNG